MRSVGVADGCGARSRRILSAVAAAVGLAAALLGRPVGAADADARGDATVETGREGAAGTRLRVLVYASPPFIERDGDRWRGWAIDLWTEVARQADLDWEITGAAQPDDIVDALAAGRADVGLGDISVTHDRAARIDFSHPFFRSGLRVLVHRDRSGSLRTAVASLLTPEHGRVFLGVLLLITAMSALVYILARRHDPENFPRTPGEGMVEALYIAAGAMMKGQLERKLMPGTPGRILSLVWMVFGTAVVAYITAAVAAALTFQRLNNDYQDVDDLLGKRVAAVAGTHNVDWLAQHGVATVGEPDIDAAAGALVEGKVDAFVHDAPVLSWWVGRHSALPLAVVGRTLDRTDYALALTRQSPLRTRINLQLLSLEENGFFAELDRRWLGGAP